MVHSRNFFHLRLNSGRQRLPCIPDPYETPRVLWLLHNHTSSEHTLEILSEDSLSRNPLHDRLIGESSLLSCMVPGNFLESFYNRFPNPVPNSEILVQLVCWCCGYLVTLWGHPREGLEHPRNPVLLRNRLPFLIKQPHAKWRSSSCCNNWEFPRSFARWGL